MNRIETRVRKEEKNGLILDSHFLNEKEGRNIVVGENFAQKIEEEDLQQST